MTTTKEKVFNFIEKSGKKLLIKGELFDNEMGKTIALAKSKGVQYNLSIGGKREVWDWEKIDGQDIIVTKKGVINEVSITNENIQAHQSAIVTKTLIMLATVRYLRC